MINYPPRKLSTYTTDTNVWIDEFYGDDPFSIYSYEPVKKVSFKDSNEEFIRKLQAKEWRRNQWK